MDHETNKFKTKGNICFEETSHEGYLRNSSLNSSGALQSQTEDEVQSGNVAEAGDIGDRALHRNGRSGIGSLILSVNDEVVESGGGTSCDVIIHSEDVKQEKLPWLFDYISCLLHLAVFGILGVGSFLMGWWGIVFKGDISEVSDHLAIGLTTGYLGSLTTFSGWNQEMLDLSIEGRWVFVVLGYILGLFICSKFIIFGVETANGFKWLLQKLNTGSKRGIPKSKRHRKHQMAVIVMLVLVLCLLWGVSGTLEEREFSSGGSGAQLWLACMVGPLGVWIRWWLARFNGHGLGRAELLKWVPLGTLMANVYAACIMAVLATLKRVVKTKNFDTVASGIQFGLLGCLSTVSTFMAEFHKLRESEQPWRAYAYATITMVTSFVLGTLIYSVPIWAMVIGIVLPPMDPQSGYCDTDCDS